MHEPQGGCETYDRDCDEVITAESSSTAASRASTTCLRPQSCVACGDEKHFFALARAPCDHEYCRACLKSLFATAMKDETLFPPRCDGQEIPLETVRFFLSSEVAEEFDARHDELSTKDRTYCFDRSCSAFIPAPAIGSLPAAWTAESGNAASCPKCKKTTCTTCKDPSHSGDCPEDTALMELIETANEAQWQRCYQCHRFVELSTGCNHIT